MAGMGHTVAHWSATAPHDVRRRGDTTHPLQALRCALTLVELLPCSSPRLGVGWCRLRRYGARRQ